VVKSVKAVTVCIWTTRGCMECRYELTTALAACLQPTCLKIPGHIVSENTVDELIACGEC
jgi:hypothetical protein